MYWTLELASKLEDAPWPATRDELLDYANRSGAPLEVIENLQEMEDEGEIYENIEDLWPDYPSKEDFFFNEEEYLRIILGDYRVAEICERASGLALHGLCLRHQATSGGDGKDEFRFAGLEIHLPQSVVLGPFDGLARILSVAGVAVIRTNDRKTRIVDGERPFHVGGNGRYRHGENAFLLRAPV